MIRGIIDKGMLALTVTAAVMAVAAPGALAAEEQRVSAESPRAVFQGKFGIANERYPWTEPITGECVPEQTTCERTAVRVEDAGLLQLAVEPPDNPFGWLEQMHLELLDAKGRVLARDYGWSGDTYMTSPVKVKPGMYTMLVKWREWLSDYVGKVSLEPIEED